MPTPLIGKQKQEYPFIHVEMYNGNLIVEIVESPVHSSKFIVQETAMRSIFITYGSGCMESIVRDMLQQRALNLGKIKVENVRPRTTGTPSEDSSIA